MMSADGAGVSAAAPTLRHCEDFVLRRPICAIKHRDGAAAAPSRWNPTDRFLAAPCQPPSRTMPNTTAAASARTIAARNGETKRRFGAPPGGTGLRPVIIAMIRFCFLTTR